MNTLSDSMYIFFISFYVLYQENLSKLFNEIVQFNAGKLQKGGGSGFGLYSECSHISSTSMYPICNASKYLARSALSDIFHYDTY